MKEEQLIQEIKELKEMIMALQLQVALINQSNYFTSLQGGTFGHPANACGIVGESMPHRPTLTWITEFGSHICNEDCDH